LKVTLGFGVINQAGMLGRRIKVNRRFLILFFIQIGFASIQSFAADFKMTQATDSNQTTQPTKWIADIQSNVHFEKLNIIKTFDKKDVSKIWLTENRNFTLGYIGENFQRLRIRILKFSKSPSNAREYLVTGKTMVKENICEFSGTFDLNEARKYRESEDSNFVEGVLFGKYKLLESPACKYPGTFAGLFTSDFIMDKRGDVGYDTLRMEADGYCNNQFVGSWSQTGTKISRVANWGDYRIPFSDKLDDGAGDFHVVEEYAAFGWNGYIKAYQGNDTQAKKQEEESWWIVKSK